MKKLFSTITSLLVALLLTGQALSLPVYAAQQRGGAGLGLEKAEASSRPIIKGTNQPDQIISAWTGSLRPESRKTVVKAFGAGQDREREFCVQQEKRQVAALRGWSLQIVKGDKAFIANRLKSVCYFTFMARLKMAMIKPKTRPANSLVRSRDGPALAAPLDDQIKLSSGALCGRNPRI